MMKEFYFIPIFANITPYQFSASQYYRLQKMIEQSGFILYRNDFNTKYSWYILAENQNIEVWLHDGALHLKSFHQNTDYQAEKWATKWLAELSFLRLLIFET